MNIVNYSTIAPRPQRPRALLRNLHHLSRQDIEAAIEALIQRLDALDGDADLEPDDEDCCPAGDDDLGAHPYGVWHSAHGPGTPEDGEEDGLAEVSRAPVTLGSALAREVRA